MSDSSTSRYTETSLERSSSSSSGDETDYEAEIDDFDALGQGQAERPNNGVGVEGVWDDELQPYQDEPLADDQWILEYERRREQHTVLDEKMQHRLRGEEPEEAW